MSIIQTLPIIDNTYLPAAAINVTAIISRCFPLPPRVKKMLLLLIPAMTEWAVSMSKAIWVGMASKVASMILDRT